MAEARVVDTDVASYVFKEDSRAETYLPHLHDRLLILCFQSVAEMWKWAELKNWGERRRHRLERFLADFSVYSSDDRLCRRWGLIIAEAKQKGRPLLAADAWVAAAALELDLPLVTNNAADFECLEGLRLITS